MKRGIRVRIKGMQIHYPSLPIYSAVLKVLLDKPPYAGLQTTICKLSYTQGLVITYHGQMGVKASVMLAMKAYNIDNIMLRKHIQHFTNIRHIGDIKR